MIKAMFCLVMILSLAVSAGCGRSSDQIQALPGDQEQQMREEARQKQEEASRAAQEAARGRRPPGR